MHSFKLALSALAVRALAFAGPASAHGFMQDKAGHERIVLLPPDGQEFLAPGDYHVALVSKGSGGAAPEYLGTPRYIFATLPSLLGGGGGEGGEYTNPVKPWAFERSFNAKAFAPVSASS